MSRVTTRRHVRARTATGASFNFIENPLACYDESRFESREEMVRRITSVYAEPVYVELRNRAPIA